MRKLLERGIRRGREEGREELRLAIRGVLEARGIGLTEEQGARIDGCADSTLLRAWARRAAIANDAEEVFG
jgi:hypothetical protein